MKTKSVSFDATRENMIELILNEKINTTIDYKVSIDIIFADSLEEAGKMGECASWEMPDFESEAKAKYRLIQQVREELKTLATHELEEEGERLRLWTVKEKQKRLITKE